MNRPGRRVLAAIAALALAAPACGSESTAPKPEKDKPDPFESIRAREEAPKQRQAGPRWETVLTKAGSGAEIIPFKIEQGAIQSRVQFSCEIGSMSITTDPQPTNKKAVAEAACPKQDEGFFTRRGGLKMVVKAQGPWQLTIQQQVTTPLNEPPLAELSAPGTRLLSRGDFYRIERKSSGKALLYRLGDGRLALRLEEFDTSANTDLYVWFSNAEKPENSQQAADSVYEEFAELKSTLGNQNYLIDPATLEKLRPEQIKSVVIWCQPVRIAYAGAALTAA